MSGSGLVVSDLVQRIFVPEIFHPLVISYRFGHGHITGVHRIVGHFLIAHQELYELPGSLNLLVSIALGDDADVSAADHCHRFFGIISRILAGSQLKAVVLRILAQGCQHSGASNHARKLLLGKFLGHDGSCIGGIVGFAPALVNPASPVTKDLFHGSVLQRRGRISVVCKVSGTQLIEVCCLEITEVVSYAETGHGTFLGVERI